MYSCASHTSSFQSRAPILPSTPIAKNPFFSRTNKTSQQKAALESHFQLNSDWNKFQIKRISEKVGLSRVQVYKWLYDRQKKAEVQRLNSAKRVSHQKAVEQKIELIQRNNKAESQSSLPRVAKSSSASVLVKPEEQQLSKMLLYQSDNLRFRVPKNLSCACQMKVESWTFGKLSAESVARLQTGAWTITRQKLKTSADQSQQ